MNRKFIFNFIAFNLIAFQLFAQLDAGTYNYFDGSLKLKLEITEGGETIKSAIIEKDGKTYSGSGEFRRAHGSEWYEFQTNACNYSFDVPSGDLVLEEYDCKSGQKSKKYTLNSVAEEVAVKWEGKYVNGHGAQLTVEKITELGFDYKLKYTGIDQCEGLTLSGTLFFDSPSKASGLKDLDNPVRAELKGNKIIFEPSCCDGDVGMNCLRFFDQEFTRK